MAPHLSQERQLSQRNFLHISYECGNLCSSRSFFEETRLFWRRRCHFNGDSAFPVLDIGFGLSR